MGVKKDRAKCEIRHEALEFSPCTNCLSLLTFTRMVKVTGSDRLYTVMLTSAHSRPPLVFPNCSSSIACLVYAHSAALQLLLHEFANTSKERAACPTRCHASLYGDPAASFPPKTSCGRPPILSLSGTKFRLAFSWNGYQHSLPLHA